MQTSGEWKYVLLEDGTVEVVGYTGDSLYLSVPSELNGYRVTRIGSEAFAKCRKELRSVTSQVGVTGIGDAGFGSAHGLVSIAIPDSVMNIGEYAFQRCTSLTAITLPDSVTYIGDYAFCYCSKLESVAIGNGVVSIGDRVFNNCPALTHVTLGSSLKASARKRSWTAL